MLLRWRHLLLLDRLLNDLVVTVQQGILVRTLIVLNLKADKNGHTCSALHGLAAGGDDANNVASLIRWEIESLRYLIVILDQLLANYRLLLVLRLTWPQRARDLRDLLQKLRLHRKVILLNVRHLPQNQLLQLCRFFVEAFLNRQWHLPMRLRPFLFLLFHPAEPDDVVRQARQLQGLPHEELLDLQVGVPPQRLEALR